MPRHCLICASDGKARVAQEMVLAGASDQAVGDRVGVSRAAAERHRKNHLRPVMQALAQGTVKDAPARQQRKQLIEAVEKGDPPDPSTLLSLSSLTSDLRKALDRIEKASDKAEQGGQLTALSGLLQQLHRNVESRAKLAGHGNFGSTKVAVGIGVGGPPFRPFTIRVNHADGRSETLVMAREGAPGFEVLDAQTGRPFAEHNGGAIVTRGEESTHDLMIVPAGYPTTTPAIDHEPGDIEQTAAPAPDDAGPVDGDVKT